MAYADDQLRKYAEQAATLRAADRTGSGNGAMASASETAFAVGFVFGAGFPQIAATITHLYRRAYPGEPLPVIFEREQ